MEKIIEGSTWRVTAEENNELVAQGYKYYVEGDWESLPTIDPWSGMPNTTANVHYFTDKAEAEAYAEKQTWVFNKNIHGRVVEATKKETKAERKAREEAERIAKAEKKAKKEQEKAQAMGMTIEAYKEYKKIEATKKRYAREIAEMEEEIAERMALIEKKKEYIKNH